MFADIKGRSIDLWAIIRSTGQGLNDLLSVNGNYLPFDWIKQ